jgi:hypothetical protein
MWGQPPSAVLGPQAQWFYIVARLLTLRVGRTAEGGRPHTSIHSACSPELVL